MVRLALPTRLSARKQSSSRTASPNDSRTSSPRPMNDSTLVLKTTVVKARNLAAKDRNGLSDPFLVLGLGDYRFTTHVVSKSLDPEWNVTFDMPLSGLSSTIMTCVCWDKDRFGKDYMGEFNVNLEELFDADNTKKEDWFPLQTTRKKSVISGEVLVQFEVCDSAAHGSSTPEAVFAKWQLWLSAVLGTPSADTQDPLLKSGDGAELDDDEDNDDDDDGDDEDDSSFEAVESGQPSKQEVKKKKRRLPRRKQIHKPYEFFGGSDVVGVIFLEVGSITDLPPERNMTRTGFDMDPFIVVSLGKKTFRTKHIRHNLNPVFDEKMIFQVLRHEQNYSLHFTVVDRDKLSGNDFVGDVTLPLQEVIATQPSPDPETGLYSLPTPSREDITGSSGGNGNASKSRFRLPLSRSSSGTNLTKKSRTPGSEKDASLLSVSQTPDSNASQASSANTQQPSPSKIMPIADTPNIDLQPFDLPINLKNKERWEAKHSPELHVRAKYVPYPALRQQFWRVMLKQYDTDDSNNISRVELTTMLDTLGSTLTAKTIDGFFKRYMSEGETLEDKELTFSQVVLCLEEKLNAASKSSWKSMAAHLPKISLPGQDDDDQPKSGVSTPVTPPKPAPESADAGSSEKIQIPKLGSAGEEGSALEADELADPDDKSEEHVIQINECPLCHQPRLHKRSEIDIVTHLATCASQDWRSVDRLVMGGFVTSSQAQRKWYSKVITKISYGGYKLGANSANILIQDRLTGQIQEERMSVYVRLGIRLLYKGLKSSSMENKRIRKLLESLSVKQGKKYDNPISAREIKGFIEFHKLNLDEVLLPLDQFKTFNEFFYRALKPGSRPCSAPDNPKVIVSPADCRSIVFNQVSDATSIWIKGRDFTIKRLLGNAYPEDVSRFQDGALGIFRLAPQDYHRFHIPVDGVLGEPKLIKGEYYTVNPMAIRSALDVYGENVRICVPIDSQEFGRVMVICVGAMMVGSTVITAEAGQKVSRTDELGYFKFGGSTLVVLFEKGRMRFDDDLIDNSKVALETLIRVGMSIGHSPDTEPPSERKENVTSEELLDARRRIEGSLAP